MENSKRDGVKGVNTPVKFGERTRNCSPGQAGKEGPHLSLTGASCGFSRTVAPVWVFPEVRWGTQGASCVVLGKSVLLLVARGARRCSGVMVGESGIKRR